MAHNGKLSEDDYPGFKSKPEWEKQKIRRAIEKRVRRNERRATQEGNTNGN